MEKLRLFYAAAFVAALTGCPGPNPMMSDAHVDPGDAGHDMTDAYVDPTVDSGVDAYVTPDNDGGMPAACSDPDYVGLECNLPMGMTYDPSAFACAVAIDNDLWTSDAVGASPVRETSEMVDGRLTVYFHFADDNGGLHMPTSGSRPAFTCGNDGACWLNWMNPSSNYSKCQVTFETDCSRATVQCYAHGSTTPIVTHADYAGPA